MKVAIPFIYRVIDTDNGMINTLVIENQRLFSSFIEDIYKQICGSEGHIVISVNDRPCAVTKNVEIIDRFVPFDINKRSIITRLNTELERLSLEDYYETSMMILSEIEGHLNTLCNDVSCDVEFSKLNIGALIRALGAEIKTDHLSTAEIIIDYMNSVRDLERTEKLFILINYRSYITDDEFELFSENILSHGFHVLLVDSASRKQLLTEKRITIDADLCEF